MRTADVVCICYSCVDAECRARVETYWLPWLQSVFASSLLPDTSTSSIPLPVILIGTKLDLKHDGAHSPADSVNKYRNVDPDVEQSVRHLMNRYPCVETCIECSAVTRNNLSEAFYYAQKAVLYPTNLIYDCQEMVCMTSSCVLLLDTETTCN